MSNLNYVERVTAALRSIKTDEVSIFVEALNRARLRASTVFIIGNGGSAATASHMATDLGVGSQRFDAGLRAISLADNVGTLTATGNDIAFEETFAAQVKLLGNAEDLLVAISASGNSRNLVAAVEVAKLRGMTVVALTGFSGGRLAKLADISVHVETEDGDYGPAEDAHLVVNHMVTELMRIRVNRDLDVRNPHG